MNIYNKPISCEWLLTTKCNMNCFFCSAQTGAQSYSLSDCFDRKELVCLIKNIKNSGVLYVNLSGGEPLLFEDFFWLLGELRKNGLIVTLNTNGTLINEDIVRQFREFGMAWVQMSILSHNKSIHDNIMGKGSFDMIINSVRLLKKYNIGVSFCSAQKNNFNKKKELEKFAKKLNIEITFRRLLKVGHLKQIKNSNSFKQNDFINEDKPYFAIMPNGDIKSCSESLIVFGNAKKSNISQIWKSTPVKTCLHSKTCCIAEISNFDIDLAKKLYKELTK